MGEKGQELELSPIHSNNTHSTPSIITSDWLNSAYSFPKDGFDLEKEILRLIELAIEQAKGNISEAARLLGVPRDYIRYRKQKQD